MDNVPAIVRIIERVTKLTRPRCNLVGLKDFTAFLSSQVRQGLAINVFHRNAARAFIVYEVVNPNDMWMSQFETALCLTLELIERRTISNHEIGKKFKRDIALQFFVACEPDNPHPAAPQDLDQRVTAKNLLSAAEFTRRRLRDAARLLVSHVHKISIIKMEGKLKR